jgi:hypothetical protein
MKVLKSISLIILLPIMVSCNLDIGEPDKDPEPIYKIRILEKGTFLPVSGALVTLLKCIKKDIQFGCVSFGPARTLTKNAQGIVEYTRSLDIEAVEASHPDYWETFQRSYVGDIFLSPNAWVKIHLERINTHSADSYINIKAGKDCYSWTCRWNFNQNIGLPADTTFVIRVEGTEKTTVFWEVISPTDGVVKSDVSEPFVLSKFDTLGMNIQY